MCDREEDKQLLEAEDDTCGRTEKRTSKRRKDVWNSTLRFNGGG
jgi:hypothetical protein